MVMKVKSTTWVGIGWRPTSKYFIYLGGIDIIVKKV